MRKRFSAILMITLGFMLAFSPVLPGSADTRFAQSDEDSLLFQDDFEEGSHPDWNLEQGWEIQEANGNHFLQGNQHTWALIGHQSWEDFRLKLHARVVSGAGLHVNFHVSGVYRYFVGIREGGIYLMKQLGPDQFEDLARAEGMFLNWHAYEISMQVNQIQVFVDGAMLLEYAENDMIPAGSIAFENLETSPSSIDDIEIWAKPPHESPESTGDYQWVRTGGPLGGLGYDVRIHPDNPDLMYVSDAFAGVFISEDAGDTWFPSNQGITTRTGNTGDAIPIFSLTIDPNNPEILWAGTQNVRGIFKSTDGGRTWQQMVNGVSESGITFRGFTVQPGDSSIVYAAAEVPSWEWNDGEPSNGREFDMVAGVVYKTTNGGETWEKIWEGDNLARYVWINPQDVGTLYVSTGIFDREAANSDPQQGLPGGEGVLKSVDGGKTWQHINNGLDNLYVGSLYMHPENPDILLAGTGNNQYPQHSGVYLTTDGGETWTQTLFGDNINAVEFFEPDPNFAYAGSAYAIYFSEDGGLTWQKMSEEDGWGPPGIRAGFPIDFQVDPGNPMRIFANNYGGGNFLSEDGGIHWVAASTGYTGAQVRYITVDPTQPAHVVAAARSGVFESMDGGKTWAGIGYPPAFSLEWNVVAFDPHNPERLLAGTNWDGILFLTQSSEISWKDVDHLEGGGVGFHEIAFAPVNPQRVYAGSAGFGSAGSFGLEYPGAGIRRSMDGGLTWQDANDALSRDAAVFGLAVNPVNPDIVYAGTSNLGLIKTADGGLSWKRLNLGRENMIIMAVAVQPDNENRVFAGALNAGIYISEDAGNTWTPTSIGLNPETSPTSIVFDPTNPEIVYLSDLHSGVYRSEDAGSTWLQINAGLGNRAINRLSISGDGMHLYAASEGMGVFRLDLNQQPPMPMEGSPQEVEEPVEAEEAAQPAEPQSEAEEPPGSTPAEEIPPQEETTGGRPRLCSSLFGLVGLAVFMQSWRWRRKIKP